MSAQQVFVAFAVALGVIVIAYHTFARRIRSSADTESKQEKQLYQDRYSMMQTFAHYLDADINARPGVMQALFNTLASDKRTAIDVVSMVVFDVIKWDDGRFRITIRHQHDHRCAVDLEHEWPESAYAESFAYAWRYEKCDQLVRRLEENGNIVASVIQ